MSYTKSFPPRNASRPFTTRIRALQNALPIDAAIIENPIDLLYFTGLSLSLGRLLVTRTSAILLVDGRYEEYAKNHSPILIAEYNEENTILFLKGCHKLGFEEEKTTLSVLKKYASWGPAPHALEKIAAPFRLIKDEDEIEKMEQSAKLAWHCFEYLRSFIQIGMTERQVACELEIYLRKQGASAASFEPIIAFGKNAALPHYTPDTTTLREGDVILIDMGVTLDHYQSDMTRVLFCGKVDPKIEELYAVTRAAHRAALKLAKPGTPIGDLDKAAREVMKEAGLEHLYLHSLGHGIGLEVHEAPSISIKRSKPTDLLKEGMVITIEPGLYLEGIGGIRYEDTIVITPSGYKNFYPEAFDPKLALPHPQPAVKADFLLTASHELRTPLAIVKGYSEILANLPAKSLDISIIHQFADKISKNVERLEAILKDFEALSRKRVDDFTKIDLTKLVRDCTSDWKELHPEVLLSLELSEGGSKVVGSSSLLHSCLTNIFGNSVKHHKGKHVDIHVALFTTPTHARLTISDNGEVAPELDLHKIFEPFYVGTKSGGTGLGLAIAKQIMELHSGSVSAARNQKNGLTFTLTLPLKP